MPIEGGVDGSMWECFELSVLLYQAVLKSSSDAPSIELFELFKAKLVIVDDKQAFSPERAE